MGAIDDEADKRPTGHVIGADLSKLSVDELRALAAALHEEIARIEAAIAAKSDSRSAAEKFFR